MASLMRQTPARYRNGYHRTLTRQQRRNRWLLWAVVALMAVGGNRWVAGCQQAKTVAKPATILVAAVRFAKVPRS